MKIGSVSENQKVEKQLRERVKYIHTTYLNHSNITFGQFIRTEKRLRKKEIEFIDHVSPPDVISGGANIIKKVKNTQSGLNLSYAPESYTKYNPGITGSYEKLSTINPDLVLLLPAESKTCKCFVSTSSKLKDVTSSRFANLFSNWAIC